jgi:hypothetical protein
MLYYVKPEYEPFFTDREPKGVYSLFKDTSNVCEPIGDRALAEFSEDWGVSEEGKGAKKGASRTKVEKEEGYQRRVKEGIAEEKRRGIGIYENL